MKIGVFLEDFTAQDGGGCTFQEAIFHSLLELAEESSHTYVVFCRRPQEIAGALKQSRIGAVAFPGSTPRRIVSRARRGLFALQKKRPLSRFQQVAQEKGIEFMWFVGDQAMQLDMPYLATVWDLQHR